MVNFAKYIILGLGGVLFFLFAKRSYEVGIGPAAQEIGSSVGSFGQGFSSVGGGIFDLFKGVGSGVAQLFNPLFTLRDLIYPPQAGNQPAPIASTEGMMGANREMNTMTTMGMMVTQAEAMLMIPAPAGPIGLTLDEARRAFNQGAVQIGIGNTQTQKQISTIFNNSYKVGNKQTQLYVNQRNELVRLQPSSARTLLSRGYLKNL